MWSLWRNCSSFYSKTKKKCPQITQHKSICSLNNSNGFRSMIVVNIKKWSRTRFLLYTDFFEWGCLVFRAFCQTTRTWNCSSNYHPHYTEINLILNGHLKQAMCAKTFLTIYLKIDLSSSGNRGLRVDTESRNPNICTSEWM